jgi:hypothetical protein
MPGAFEDVPIDRVAVGDDIIVRAGEVVSMDRSLVGLSTNPLSRENLFL